jgi:uncharacterized membrane protein YcgQ (UPF0703/DUF1980 family)
MHKATFKASAIAIAACLILLGGCSKAETAPISAQTETNGNGTQAVGLSHDVLDERIGSDIVDIPEKMFIAQTNDIYLNAPDYIGKTIRYEGLFAEFQNIETGATYYSVIRYGPGCCGIDGNAGFEIKWDGKYPEPHDWVKVAGTLEEYEEDGSWYLQLRLDEMNVLAVRGAETVTQ